MERQTMNGFVIRAITQEGLGGRGKTAKKKEAI